MNKDREIPAQITEYLDKQYGDNLKIEIIDFDSEGQNLKLLVKKPIFLLREDYSNNPGDPVSEEEYETVEGAEKSLNSMSSPSEWASRYAEHYAFLVKKIVEKTVEYEKDEDGDWGWPNESKWKNSDDEDEDLGIAKSFGTRESGANDLLTKAYFNLREDVNGEYEYYGIPVFIGKGSSGKYGSVFIYDKDDNQLGIIEIRIADHSYNPRNRSNIYDGFISVVIANKDETKGKFSGQHNLYFDSDNDYDDIVSETKDKVQEILNGLDIEQRIKKATDNFKEGGITQKKQEMNLLIGDNFFKQNPDKVLGTQTTRKGQFGNDVIVVEGSLSDIEKIDASPVPVVDLYPEQALTVKTEQQVIEKVFETEEKETTAKKVKERRIKQASVVAAHKDAEVYTFQEIDALYNKGITLDEKEAYYFTHPELNYKLLFDKYTNTKESLIAKKMICWDADERKFVYYIVYASGHIGKKISTLYREKERFISEFGEQQWQLQLDMLNAAKPKQKGLVGDERITILPHSRFAKEFKIMELRYGKPQLYGESSLFDAFQEWLRELPPDNFKKTTYREIIKYYLKNEPIPVNDSNKEQKKKDEMIAINIRQRTKEEGDALFARFLSDELTPDDQAKLQHLWNDKFNSYAEPDFDKIPIVFLMGKKFKKGPLNLNPTQRQSAAFMQEKFSGLLAYGVGIGKTLASIVCFSSAYYNGYAKKGVFVVPTNTYDKWIGEIQGYTDKETKEFMHGALPQLPPIVGLFNLNPTLVKETLKEYSTKDQSLLDTIMNAITKVKSVNKEDLTEGQRQIISKIYPLNWEGLYAQYNNYLEFSKATNKKTFTDYVIEYLRDEYNYYIYKLGTIKPFPDGTIFVTTEVGLQRLGVNEENQQELVSVLYEILSQGEKTADKESKREVAKLQEKIEQTVSSSQANAKLFVEDFGINWACFDEAHYYKKVFTYVKGDIVGEKTKWDSESGGYQKVGYKRDKAKYELKSGQYPSSRALSAFSLSYFIQLKNNNRNVVQLTATPFTNSPLEVYSMLALTNFKLLSDLGVGNMVDFFDTFMKINYDIKYTPQKTVVKDIVLTGYNNLPQLRQIIYSLMDKKDQGASPKRPTKIIYPSVEKGIETTLPMTSEQEELMKETKKYINGATEYESICNEAYTEEVNETDFDGLDDETLIAEYERVTGKDYEGDRDALTDSKRESIVKQIKSAKIQGMEFDEGALNEDEKKGVRILKGLSMMRQITLSPYLFYKACEKAKGSSLTLPKYEDYVNSSPKFKYTMGCIASAMAWHKKTGTKPGGHVIYMNAGVEYFPLLKEYLVKKVGLKESQVGIVSGSMSKSAKENVKQAFLRGDMLVLIGSSTISVGVDLQNNATTLYNLYYDWNPTDAAQIEGRIWRQGNRFGYVRIIYPQCYNSADPVIFEYLNSKTLRINEIWNRSSELMELDLRDFNPKELQKKLITDPEEKADWEILELKDKIDGEIIYAENRRESLENAMYAFREVNKLRPEVRKWLSGLSTRKLEMAKAEAVATQKNKINEIVDKYGDDPSKMADEIAKYKKSRYDHEKDPDGKYVAPDYAAASDDVLYNDAKKYGEIVDDWDYRNSDFGDLYNARETIKRDLRDFRGNYRDMKAAEERILKPMGLSFTTAENPISDFNNKIKELKEQLEAIEATRQERINRFRAEAAASAGTIKTVQDRIDEYASANEQYLAPQLHTMTANQTEEIINPTPVEKPKKDEIIVPKAEAKLAAQQSKPLAKPKEKKEVAVSVDKEVDFSKLSDKQLQRRYDFMIMQLSNEDTVNKKEIESEAMLIADERVRRQYEKTIATPAAASKAVIEKQINGLRAAKDFADDPDKIEREITGLQAALMFAA